MPDTRLPRPGTSPKLRDRLLRRVREDVALVDKPGSGLDDQQSLTMVFTGQPPPHQHQMLEALAQRRVLFDRRLDQDRQLFKLTLTMLWTSYFAFWAFNFAVAVSLIDLRSPYADISTALVYAQGVGAALSLLMTVGRRSVGELEASTPLPVDAPEEDASPG